MNATRSLWPACYSSVCDYEKCTALSCLGDSVEKASITKINDFTRDGTKIAPLQSVPRLLHDQFFYPGYKSQGTKELELHPSISYLPRQIFDDLSFFLSDPLRSVLT